MIQIDAHQHYWHPARADYGWMPPDDPILTRPYGPADLAPALAETGVRGTVLVQAAPTREETAYMLGLADATPSVLGVVGWVDFERPEDEAHLERFAAHPKFRGIRPMIQDIPDTGWMLRDDVQWAYGAASRLGLTFDALGFPCHLEPFLTLFQRHPGLRVVIDHGMKPRIADHTPETYRIWAAGMTRLAKETGAYVKLSGLVTEAGADWSPADLRPYTDLLLDAFGPSRVMWGSDWPVCRLRSSYRRWHETALGLTAHLTEADRARVFGGTARDVYRLAV